MGTRQWGRLLILTAMIAAVTMIGTSGVSAHAQFKSADPAPNATVNKAPTQIMLVFSEETSPTKSGGSVTQGLFIVGKVRRSLKRSLKIVRFLADFPTVCKQWND